MIEESKLLLFLTAAIILLITPGPAVLYIITRSVDRGPLAGIVSGLGLSAGSLIHLAATVLGVSALLLASTIAFNVVKYLGAAYLIYLGISRLLERNKSDSTHLNPQTNLKSVFYQGITVNVLNPKAALFFFAFLPQFVDPSRGAVTVQILTLGMIFILLGMMSDSLYALLAGTLGKWLKGNARFLQAQRFFAGWVYIALGLATVLTGARKK
ncbi:LysE family translocator [candidate division KSB1 bacterium]|nr:LysE family translocator [candidate division KSB1 bacterium]NIR73063.1 LysE family translocator [candidate division KSB1 bacterium]NIS28304.1 LysE family translocator [candidate division KSB1 bacterium]NIT75173.1 LysE family translocator [candidate division KSB1 bacterium]NIU29010.1 LysE family translocator [candidate division KSB1 bacterium]